MPSIDVIIPVYNPPPEFDGLFEKLDAQTLKPGKIILLNTVAEGGEGKEASRAPGTRCRKDVVVVNIRKKDFDHGGTRRIGMELSDGEFALCMTQDAMPCNDKLIESLYDAFKDEDVGAAYARQVPRKGAGAIERITREFNYPREPRVQNKDTFKKYGIKTYFCSNVCAMYRKRYYDEAGGFVKRTIFNEDMLMAAALIEAGHTVRYVPEAAVSHSHSYSCVQQFKRNFDLAVSHKEYSEVFSHASSESEGMRLVKETMARLVKEGKPYLIPELVMQSGFKYLGYRFGLAYDRLPKRLVLKMTMNKDYWK